MKTVFVTGASGFLGNNLVVYLLQKGYKVKAYVRSRNSMLNLKHQNLEPIVGALNDVKLLRKGIEHSDFVVHTAANTSQSLLRLRDYDEVNIKATQLIVEACKRFKVQKLIYIGTANTYGYGSLKNPGQESSPMKYPFTKSLYALSKQQCLTYIKKASHDLNITILSPTFLLGGLDHKPSSGKLVLSALNKRFVFYPKGGKNFIHVLDVVKCIEQAFYRRTSSEEIILAHENISYKAFFEKLIVQNQQKSCLIKIPNTLLIFMGLIGEMVRFMGFKTNLSRANTKILSIHNYYTNAKAKTVFNTSFISIDEAIDDTVDWFNLKSKS